MSAGASVVPSSSVGAASRADSQTSDACTDPLLYSAVLYSTLWDYEGGISTAPVSIQPGRHPIYCLDCLVAAPTSNRMDPDAALLSLVIL